MTVNVTVPLADISPQPTDSRSRPLSLHVAAHRLQSKLLCGRGLLVGVMRQTPWHVLVVPMTCKQWSCPQCAIVKKAKWAEIANAGKPQKFLTLTCNPLLHDSAENALVLMNKTWTRLVGLMRKQFGSVEYLRVVEPTAKGWPHFHILLRSKFIPQKWLSEQWQHLTGAPIVDIRNVYDADKCARYVLKHMTKRFTRLCEEMPNKRLVNKSRGWISPEKMKALFDSGESQVSEWHQVTGIHLSHFLSDLAASGAQLVAQHPITNTHQLDARYFDPKACDFIDTATVCFLLKQLAQPPPTFLDTLMEHPENKSDEETPTEKSKDRFTTPLFSLQV